MNQPASPFHVRLLSTLCCAGLAVALTRATSAQTIPTIVSDFDNGTTQGWTHQGASLFYASTTGGNPGGYLHIDNSEGPVTYIYAPASFLGDRRSYRGGTLSFDGRMIGTGGAPWTSPLDYGHVWLSNGTLQISVDLVPNLPTTATYSTYSVVLQPANWNTTSATFEAVLANITELRISVEALFGDEVQAIDNVTLAPGPTPASAVVAGAGCAGDVLAPSTLPWIGATFQATASGLPSPCLACVVFGLTPLAPPLALAAVLPQAVPGCFLHTSPDLILASYETTGTLTTQLAVPNAPSLVGATFQNQVVSLQVDAGLQILAITSTNGLAMTIGAY